MLSKSSVHTAAINEVTNKLKEIQREYDALQESLMSETKSSAGDKHETGRAMTQLAQEKLSSQLVETKRQLDGLRKIDPNEKLDKIGLGSLIQTSRGTFFVSVGIGQIKVDGTPVFCITAGSPIGQKLLQKQAGDSIQLNGEIQIIEIS